MSEAETMERTDAKPRFEIYRNSEAKDFAEFDLMDYKGVTAELSQMFTELGEAGVNDGQVVKMLFAAPGFSLTYAWFKSGFPLPRHTHSADCLYYIIAGSLQLGTETLGRGDGFFLPKDMAYAYTPGAGGGGGAGVPHRRAVRHPLHGRQPGLLEPRDRGGEARAAGLGRAAAAAGRGGVRLSLDRRHPAGSSSLSWPAAQERAGRMPAVQ